MEAKPPARESVGTEVPSSNGVKERGRITAYFSFTKKPGNLPVGTTATRQSHANGDARGTGAPVPKDYGVFFNDQKASGERAPSTFPKVDVIAFFKRHMPGSSASADRSHSLTEAGNGERDGEVKQLRFPMAWRKFGELKVKLQSMTHSEPKAEREQETETQPFKQENDWGAVEKKVNGVRVRNLARTQTTSVQPPAVESARGGEERPFSKARFLPEAPARENAVRQHGNGATRDPAMSTGSVMTSVPVVSSEETRQLTDSQMFEAIKPSGKPPQSVMAETREVSSGGKEIGIDELLDSDRRATFADPKLEQRYQRYLARGGMSEADALERARAKAAEKPKEKLSFGAIDSDL